MKQFEHEFLVFDMASKKGLAQMRATLAEWGAAGYELVSVVPSDMHSRSVTAFLKREIAELTTSSGEAA
ncbi:MULTISPECIES: hypothetical protein [Rhodobacterales]|jgi:hypothetical protein|uniref:DUF4177 domain-containing protein n=1 Tax=Neptunicoccus cionae TaxID=2035344 RepID=A0A916R573_9RHOB|nr:MULTISPECIES: hypothetical protein [Rhodobacterales]MDR6267365.1 hypothetical protein [Roseobacter sp. N2S]GGA31895.1 hypothetical protein GCM10011498_36370 [Amylibacter cionae]